MEEVHIALASDENYRAGLLVTACSIAEHAAHDVRLVIHVLDGGITEETWDILSRRIAALHPSVRLHRVVLSRFECGSMLKGLPIYHGGTMTYARLILPHILASVEFCIYCDVDFLWLADVAELWKNHDAEVLMQGVLEPCKRTLDAEESWARANGTPFDKARYICAGLSFFNLGKARKENFTERTLAFLRQYPSVTFGDQTAINAVLGGSVKLIDEKWQRLTVALKGLKPSRDFVLHFAGNAPWKIGGPFSVLTDAALIWFSHYARYAGKSRSAALLEFMSVWQILFGRLKWHAVRCPVTRAPFFFLLSLAGHGGCRDMMLAKCEKVGLA